MIRAARSGSLQHLKSLAIAARRIGADDLDAVLDTFRDVLANIGEIGAFDRAVTTSSTCFMGLDFIRSGCSPADWPAREDSFITALSDAWPPFSVWLFAAPDIDFFRKESDERLPFLRSVRLSLTVVSRLPTERSSAVCWSRLAHFAFRLWLKIELATAGELSLLHDILLLLPVEKLLYKDIVKVAGDNGMGVVTFLNFTIGRLKHFGRRLQSLPASLGASTELVQRLCAALSSAHLVVVALLRSESGRSPATSAPELKDPFIRIVSLSTRFMRTVLPTLCRRYSSVFRSVESSLILVAMLLDVLPDVRAIKVALQRGLILSILSASCRSKDLRAQGILAMDNLVGRILPFNLVFLSVFVSVRKSVSLCRRRKGDQVAFSDGPALNTAWNYLFKLIDHYTCALAYFQKRRREGVFTCANVRFNALPACF